MTTICTAARPKSRCTVRRRRYADTPWLVRRNDWYELDEVADAIWRACDGSLSIEQITRRVAHSHNLPLGEALAATVGSVMRFQELELLDLSEPRPEAG